MSSEIERHSWTGIDRRSQSGVSGESVAIRTGGVRIKAMAAWGKLRIIAATVLSALIGMGFGQLVIWLAAHETVSTYIAFIPGNMEIAGVSHEQIRMVTTRAVMEALNHLLQDYDRLCQEHPLAADARRIDCDRVHKMSREPIPEN